MENDLTTPHLGWTSVGEDEIDVFLKFMLRQIADVGSVPVVHFLHFARECLEIGHFFRARPTKRVRQPQQVMLKDLIDDMDVVEDTQEYRSVLRVQPLEMLGDDIIEASIGPLFVANEL